MADYTSRCAMLAVGLLFWVFILVKPAAITVKRPEGCTLSLQDTPPPNLQLFCSITAANIKDILYEMKQAKYDSIYIHWIDGLDIHFDHDAFHPNLRSLFISGNKFSISTDTLRGLSKLRVLFMTGLYLDSLIHKDTQELYSNDSTAYPQDINYTSLVYGTGWFKPLTNLRSLTIKQSDISSFNTAELCSMNQLQVLRLRDNSINSMEGLGIACNTSFCTPCLPNLTELNISGNPIMNFTLNISRNLPNLRKFEMSRCNLQVLYLDSAISESIKIFSASYNKQLHSLLLDKEDPCNLPHLRTMLLIKNHLHTISPGLFLCMQHLHVLFLSGNALTAETLIGAGLNHLTEIMWLELSYNKIATLQPALIGNMTELLLFQCTACGLTTIDKDTFTHIKKLTLLSLYNNYLSMIDAGSFSHFLMLQKLDLSKNALNQITLTENLVSLLELDLSDNLLSAIPEFPGSWPNLSTLAMDRNQITHIGPQGMAGLTSLTKLSLTSNRIELIPDKTFANQDSLEHLILSNNSITTISEFGFNGLPSLTHLSLDNNHIFQAPALGLQQLHRLQFLNLSRNLIKASLILEFQHGFSLRGIDLSHNYISQMKVIFLLFEHLEYVNLSYNQLRTLDGDFFRIYKLPRYRIYIEGNPLCVDCNSKWIFDTKLDKTFVKIKEKTMKKHGTIGNWTIFADSAYLPFASKLPASILKVSYYPKIADWDLLQGTTATGEIKSFSELSSADLICPYTWICYGPDCTKGCCENGMDCPCSTFCYADCTCYHNTDGSIHFMNCSSRNLTSLPSGGPTYVRSITLDGNYLTSINSSTLNFPYLMKLNAANSNISHLQPGAFINLKTLQVLHLEQNKIETISKQTFAFLIHLEELYLQENYIYQIDNDSFSDLVHLKVLLLHANNLRHLHQSLFKRTYSLNELTLHENPWSCDCQSGPAFKEWLIHTKFIVHRSNIYCHNTFPSDTAYGNGTDSKYNMTNTANITALPLYYQPVVDNDFSTCTNRSIIERVYNHTIRETVHHHSKSITEVVSLATVFTILVILTLVIYKTRLLLRVWFYNKFGVRFHQEEDDNEDKPYDLFIAYAKADERLVMHELLPNLEEEDMSYKVCLECRDWPPGAATTESVVASVELSKRTIILVSPNHLDTQWCEYSFIAAHYQVFKDKQIRLILVLTDVELEARLTRAMKLYMKTNTFLVIGEKWFWKKLRYYLAVNPRGADHVVGREFRLMNAY